VASDHAPYDQESKRVPFNHAAPGVLGLETLLVLMLELYHKGEASLIDLLRRMTTAPADLLGLPQGRLTKGAPADLLLFDPDRPARIEVDKFRSKSKNSPFDGRPVQGKVLLSIVDGRTVFSAKA
jgi:dihydroorotase